MDSQYFSSERIEEAMTDYDQAIRLRPDDAASYVARGSASFLNEEFDKALADFSEAVRLHPDDRDLQMRAETYELKGEYQAAHDDFSKIIELSPKRASAVHKPRSWTSELSANSERLSGTTIQRLPNRPTGSCSPRESVTAGNLSRSCNA